MNVTRHSRAPLMFPKTVWGMHSGSTKWGVPMLKTKERESRELLVLGTGRCGTTTIANVFQKMGLDLQRERVGAYGTSSLFFTVDSDWHPRWTWEERCHIGERRSDYIFEHIFHIVRNPVKTIPSMGAVFPGLMYEFFEDNEIIPIGIKSQLLRCAHAYYNLNILSEEQAELRFRVEDLSEKKLQKEIVRILGLDRFSNLPPIPISNKASGYRKRDPLDWSKLDALDHTLCGKIQSMATRYGY